MPANSSTCGTHQNDTFLSDVVTSAPDLLKERVTNSPATGVNSRSDTPIVNKLLNNANNGSFPELGFSPLSPGVGKKLKDLPHTTTLKGCVAYVDVWSSDATDNRSNVFRNFLLRMGATVPMKFNKTQPITHLVFKDGHKSSLQKAIKRNVKIVNCLWVDRCRVLQEWVSEEDFLFDPTNYKPPKRFREMQPLDPEEMLRRSEESLKRRKARYEKKNARIMFQSPLVTNCYSANATPSDSNTPINGKSSATKPSILARDTPFSASSLARFFSPSIIYETPMTDSMLRKMQRYKEGKRIFSPPTSDDDESDNEDKTESSVTCTSKSDSAAPDVPEFSPVPETQCIGRKSWRESGKVPPKLNFIGDEIPETQELEAPDTPEFRQNPIETSGEGLNEIPETQQLSTSHTDQLSQAVTSPLYSSTAKENESTTSSKLSNHMESSSGDVTDSMKELRLRVSSELSEIDDTTHEERSIEPQIESNVDISKLGRRRKRKRKLIHDDDYLEPTSILLSAEDQTETTGLDQSSMVLPKLGSSTVKNLRRSGRFFPRLKSPISGRVSTRQSREPSPCNSQSTDFGEDDDECLGNGDDDNDVFPAQPQTPLSLYDRVKMRKQRLSVLESESPNLSSSYISTPPPSKRSKKTTPSPETEKSNYSVTRSKRAKSKKRLQFDPNMRKSMKFSSQAANSIVKELKKRRSTMDFTSPVKQLAVRKPNHVHIVLTNFHSKERYQIHQSVKRFPCSDISPTVREETTHVVCGTPRRTLNVLRAIVFGSWLLSKDWVTDSLSAGFWLEEASYEIISSFPAAQENRRRKSDDPTWKNELLHDFKGHMYIAKDTKPETNVIKELITLCGGAVIGNLRRAAICIGNPQRSVQNIPVVLESWLLDSICENEIKPVDQYLIDVT